MEKVQQKYDLLLQEEDSTHLQQKKTLDDLCEKVLLNQSLADDFRAKFISSSGAQGIYLYDFSFSASLSEMPSCCSFSIGLY